MAEKRKGKKYARRDFLKGVAAGGGLASTLGAPSFAGQNNKTTTGIAGGGAAEKSSSSQLAPIDYPRTFTGRNLKMIAFPLGGIGTGTVSLGGRGQLRDWEIFNRPDKGNELSYAFPAIWAKVGESEPVVRVLESRLQPPYERNPAASAPITLRVCRDLPKPPSRVHTHSRASRLPIPSCRCRSASKLSIRSCPWTLTLPGGRWRFCGTRSAMPTTLPPGLASRGASKIPWARRAGRRLFARSPA